MSDFDLGKAVEALRHGSQLASPQPPEEAEAGSGDITCTLRIPLADARMLVDCLRGGAHTMDWAERLADKIEAESSRPPPSPEASRLTERVRVLEQTLRTLRSIVKDYTTMKIRDVGDAMAQIDAFLHDDVETDERWAAALELNRAKHPDHSKGQAMPEESE